MPQSRRPDPEKGPPLRNRAAASVSAARAGSRLALFARGRHALGCGPAAAGAPDQPARADMLSRSYPCGSPATSNSIIGPRIGLGFSQFPLIFASSSSSEAFGALFSECRPPPQRGNPSAAFTTFVRGARRRRPAGVWGGPWRPGARAASARPTRGRLCAVVLPRQVGQFAEVTATRPHLVAYPPKGAPSLTEPLRRSREAVTPICCRVRCPPRCERHQLVLCGNGTLRRSAYWWPYSVCHSLHPWQWKIYRSGSPPNRRVLRTKFIRWAQPRQRGGLGGLGSDLLAHSSHMTRCSLMPRKRGRR